MTHTAVAGSAEFLERNSDKESQDRVEWDIS